MKTRWLVWAGIMALCASAASAAMIANWTFDDTLTNSASSAYGAVSTGTGTPQYSTNAIYGKSLKFTNPAGHLNATNKLAVLGGGDWAGSSSWTFSAWINPTVLAGATQAVFAAGGVSGGYTLYADFRNGNLNTYYNDDGTNASTGVGAVAWGVAAGNWARLTVVFDAVNHTVAEYRDSSDAEGGLVLLKSVTNYYIPMTITNFVIGYNNGSQKAGFQGYMDDVQIYNTALSAAQVDVIPEPATLGLLGISAGVVLLIRRAKIYMS